MDQPRQCPRCGAALAPDAPAGLCPACLMKAGLGPRTDATGAPITLLPSGPSPEPLAAIPEVGQQFGAYRLVRLLGRGGMGSVYEAEHLESGRRVALKVLSHSLDSPEAQARFLREGRLAASINHPNSVYIYGTEEVYGTPVITMELVAGGTLEDRVRQKGPMPVADAADAILQIIEGLEAALAVGVLHRDVKPSNCFLEAGGAVKVGDFGLSISTRVRRETTLTTTGAFLGTPAFSSPEQLRGDELDVRSDIYAVGVTLYYLLTGHTPFKADNLIRFVATVLERPAESPARFRPEIPKGLCQVVLRCLEKQPSRRFRGYADLRAALLPFASAAPTPATLGWRALAYLVDMVLWCAMTSPLGYVMFSRMGPLHEPASYRSPLYIGSVLVGFAMGILYWALAEGLWGASLGKAICRLRVVGPGRGVPGVPRALLRAAIFLLTPVLPLWTYLAFDPGEAATLFTQAGSAAIGFSQFAVLALLFATARRRNGFAGLHELASRTRVIHQATYEARPVLHLEEPPPPVSESTPTIGPYYVLDRLGKTETEGLLLGYDARLLRKVWIRRLPKGAPPLDARLRNLGRATRLRWLGGSRAGGEDWDAYEAVPGRPLLALLGARQPWRSVRYWLLDLAEELQAGLSDGSVPEHLGLDRVWITADGRAKLLDFPAPGIDPAEDPSRPPAPTGTGFTAARLFLTQVAVAALEGRMVDPEAAHGPAIAVPLPLQARAFLGELPAFQDFGPLVGGLKALVRKVASVTRLRRFGLAVGGALVPVLVAVAMLFGQLAIRHFIEQQPDILPLQACLIQLSMLEKQSDGKDRSEERQAIEVYIAGRFGKTISDPTTWSNPFAAGIPEDMRLRARQIVARYPNPSEKQLAEATAVAEPLVGMFDMTGFLVGWSSLPLVALQASMFLLLVAAASLVSAIAFRGGLVMRTLGVAAVKRDGSPAGRLRVFWRAVVAWSPVPLGMAGCIVSVASLRGGRPEFADIMATMGMASALAMATFAALTVVSTLMPQRGIQDRLAGTWLVPR